MLVERCVCSSSICCKVLELSDIFTFCNNLRLSKLNVWQYELSGNFYIL